MTAPNASPAKQMAMPHDEQCPAVDETEIFHGMQIGYPQARLACQGKRWKRNRGEQKSGNG